jgi:hypothetical protein
MSRYISFTMLRRLIFPNRGSIIVSVLGYRAGDSIFLVICQNRLRKYIVEKEGVIETQVHNNINKRKLGLIFKLIDRKYMDVSCEK